MTRAKPLSICATTDVNEMFRIASHIQGRLNSVLAEASVLEERAQLLASEVGKRELQDEIVATRVLLRHVLEIIELWCSLPQGQDRKSVLADMEKLIVHFSDAVEASKDESSPRTKKFQDRPPPSLPESSREYLLRVTTETR